MSASSSASSRRRFSPPPRSAPRPAGSWASSPRSGSPPGSARRWTRRCPPGSAGVIAIYDHAEADAVAGALANAIRIVDGPDRQGVREGAQGGARRGRRPGSEADDARRGRRPRLRRRHRYVHRDRRRHGRSSRRRRASTSSRESGARSTARPLRAQAPGSVTPLIIDVTDEATISAAAATVADAVGDRGLAGLVNNAGIGEPAPIEFQPMADFRTQLEVNLFGPVAMIQAFLPLIRRGGGRIVNVGSIGGMLVLPAERRLQRVEVRDPGDQRRAAARAAPVEHPRVPDRGRARQDRDLRQDATPSSTGSRRSSARRATGCTSSRSRRSGRPSRRRRPTRIPRS